LVADFDARIARLLGRSSANASSIDRDQKPERQCCSECAA
jgi:hypothetical protein